MERYTAELVATICLRIAEGESLRSICADKGMPDKSTVLRWLAEKPEFREQYALARELQADLLVDEAKEIADDATHDMKLVEGENGPPVMVVNHEHISRSRLRVDTRKWMAGKLAPKKYGERMALTGADGGPIATRDETARSTPARVMDDLKAIFGGDLVAAEAAKATPRRHRMVRPRPRSRRSKKP